MDASFVLIHDLVAFLRPLPAWWFVSAGWAIDLHLDRITRPRCDLDISVPFSERHAGIEFFLARDWTVEGKRFGGFKAVRRLADQDDDIHYFWSFPAGGDFVGEYVDEGGNRRIAYRREAQDRLDYTQVFFDRIDGGIMMTSTGG